MIIPLISSIFFILLGSHVSAEKLPSSSDGLSPCSSLIEPSVLTVDTQMLNVKAARGAQVVLRCAFYGSPQPSIVWYHRRRRVEQHVGAHFETLLSANSLGQSVVEAALRIDCLDESTAGEYFCEATSQCAAQPAISSAIVSIDRALPSESTCKSARRRLESPPIISFFTISRIELPGGVAQLACRARGQPTPITKWMKIEEDESLTSIQGQPNYMHLANGDLLIVGDESTISESFRCVAENSFGHVHQDATVIYMLP